MKLRLRLKIKQKILFYTLSVTAFVFIITVIYIGFSSRKQVSEITIELADGYAREYANLSAAKLAVYIDATRFLRQTFENTGIIPEPDRRAVLSGILLQLLQENPDFLAAWSILNPGTIDGRDSLFINTIGSTILGNFRYIYYREGGIIKLSEYVEQNPNEVMSGFIYNSVKRRLQETVIEPDWYSYSGRKQDEVLQTSMVAPVMMEGEFIGVVGIDVPLVSLQQIIDSYQPVPESFAFLLSNAGEIVTFPDGGLIGSILAETSFISQNKDEVIYNIKNQEFTRFQTNYNQKQYFVSVAPIEIGKSKTPWYVGIAFPQKVMMETATNTLRNALMVGLAGLILIGIVIWILAESITKPVRSLTSTINLISTGAVDEKMHLDFKSGDEIAEMGQALNQYISGYLKKSNFALQIGSGNLDADFKLKNDEDYLGKSLIDMRDNLRNARNEERIRKLEDKKRTWTNEGLNKFAEILRQNHNSLENMCYEVISNLVRYLNANQGGVFLLSDESPDDIHFELKATYAYNRRKFMEKTIKPGVGLIGTCAIEKETIYLTDIPQGYIEITSGLGDANPDSLLIVPMKAEDEILGVFEIASFQKIEKYQIEFVERMGLNIASAIRSMRINFKNAELLEKFRLQTEEMKAQEEEMRQNMEELQSTQESMEQKDKENQRIIQSLKTKLDENC